MFRSGIHPASVVAGGERIDRCRCATLLLGNRRHAFLGVGFGIHKHSTSLSAGRLSPVLRALSPHPAGVPERYNPGRWSVGAPMECAKLAGQGHPSYRPGLSQRSRMKVEWFSSWIR